MTLYIAEVGKNAIFQRSEQDPSKILCFPQDVSFVPNKGAVIDEKFFMKMIELIKQDSDVMGCWIVAIGYMDNIFQYNKSDILVVEKGINWKLHRMNMTKKQLN